MNRLLFILIVSLLAGCGFNMPVPEIQKPEIAVVKPAGALVPDSGNTSIPTLKVDSLHKQLRTAGKDIDSLIMFAESLTGTKYKYASTDPAVGFDCSGFITYVFNHFGIAVPRSSRDFEFVGNDVPILDSRRGDLILFTGTDSTERIIGHMGIITANDGGRIRFIHSSSGKANGVITTDMNKYYEGRFMKVIRVF